MSAATARLFLFRYAPICRFSRTDRFANTPRPSGDIEMPRATSLCVGLPPMSSSSKVIFAGAWFEQAGDGAQRGGFAGAVRADERDDFALLDVQRDAGQRFDGAVVYRDVVECKHLL